MPQTLRVMAYNILYGGTPGGNGGAPATATGRRC